MNDRQGESTMPDKKPVYSYFPGCSAESTARDLHRSTLAVAEKLGMELREIPGWTCCGATAAHQTDPVLAAALPALNLAKARDDGAGTVLVNCAACYNRMKTANHEIRGDDRMRADVAEATGMSYDGGVHVRHFIEVLLSDVGAGTLSEKIVRRLTGVSAASYYGCLLVRPNGITGFDDPEDPRSIDTIVRALGAKALDWPHKVECCGGGLSLSRTDVVVRLADSILGMAKDSGADCIVTACPMCQVNLDLRQSDVEKKYGRRYELPVLYLTQLIGLAMDIPPRKLGLEKLMVPPDILFDRIGYTV